jgi:hypothetical protein
LGFDQDVLDDLYAKYDDPDDELENFSKDDFRTEYERTKGFLLVMERRDKTVTTWAKGFGTFYTLWAVIALHTAAETNLAEVANRYAAFMQQVDELAQQKDIDAFLKDDSVERYRLAYRYFDNARGASTDLTQRQARVDALRQAILL